MFLRKIMLLFLVFSILCFMTNCGETVPQEVVIKLRPEQKFQIITGWEATSQSGQNNSPAFEKYKDKLFDDAVNNLGINRLRLEMKSGTENSKDWFSVFKAGQISEGELNQHRYETINDNDNPFVINPDGFQFSQLDSSIENVILPVKKLLEQRNEKLFVNLNMVDFDKNRGNANFLLKDNPEEYAEFILAVYQHIQSKYGFVPDTVEVVLEPDNHTGWTATNIGQAIVATAKRLREHNFKPAFIAPSTTNAANAPIYIDEIAAVADAAVIGRADEKWQEVPVAYIVPRPGETPDPAGIERFCLGQLARYKVPRDYVFVDSLPRNAMGKVQHFRLKELIADGTVGASADAPGTEQKTDENRRSGRWQWLVGGSR